MAQIAYKRVSSVDQNLDRQLSEVNIEFEKVFEEKISGSIKDRPQLVECLNWLREGDTLHVHSIDRLARDLSHLSAMVKQLTERGVNVHFHKENMIFTSEHNAMEKLMLQLMGAFAEFERAMIRERQREGIAIAKANGKFIGRKPIDEEIRTEVKALRKGHVPVKVIAKALDISVPSVYNIIKENK